MKSSSSLPEPNAEPLKGNGETILVVDDEKPVLDMATIIFELGGYKVITANNAMLAFEIFEKKWNQIAAVLLDISMPIMNGVELSRILVEINPEVKIIASSGHATVNNELELRNLGVNHFLPKPYNVRQLMAMVHNAIHGESPAD